MATPNQIAELRITVQELDNAEPYTDTLIGNLIDANGMTDAAYKIWVAKRNMAASLVDISEGGSSRKNSQLFESYSKIVAGYEDDGGAGPTGARAPRTREITRG
jgi:hypothetical protein